jgi:hypothetical protein
MKPKSRSPARAVKPVILLRPEMQVKLFSSQNSAALEEEMNMWLGRLPAHTIVAITQSSGPAVDGSACTTISIFYRG